MGFSLSDIIKIMDCYNNKEKIDTFLKNRIDTMNKLKSNEIQYHTDYFVLKKSYEILKFHRFFSSISLIFWILFICLSPFENGVFKKVCTISFAVSIPVVLCPKARILASLCYLVSFAIVVSVHKAQRMPFTLLAAMEIPIPVPHKRIPQSTF